MTETYDPDPLNWTAEPYGPVTHFALFRVPVFPFPELSEALGPFPFLVKASLNFHQAARPDVTSPAGKLGAAAMVRARVVEAEVPEPIPETTML